MVTRVGSSGFIATLTHHESWSAEAGAADTVAVGSVAAGAGLAAALAVVSRRTRLVAVQTRPSGRTGALS